MASVTQAMVLAVKRPWQDPPPGQASHSRCCEIFLRDLAGLEPADRLEGVVHEVQPFHLVSARHHRPRRDDNGRHIQPGRRHQHAGGDLVAVRQQHEAVEPVGHRDALDHVGDQFAAGQAVMHPLVAHGHAVADAGDREEPRDAAAGKDAVFDGPFQPPHVGVAGNQVRETRHEADERLVDLIGREVAGGHHEGPRRHALQRFAEPVVR